MFNALLWFVAVVWSINNIAAECPYLYTEYKGGCYRFVNEQLTWSDANAFCAQTHPNGELVSVLTEDEDKFVRSMTGTTDQYFIGLRYSEEGEFVWSDGSSSVEYTNWFHTEPNTDLGNCTLINYYPTSHWRTYPCESANRFVCEIGHAKEGTCGTWHRSHGDYCYLSNTTEMTWMDAEIFCNAIDPDEHLVSLHSTEEENFVLEMMGTLTYWIGYNDIMEEDTWVWTDGSAVSYTNWHSGRPYTNDDYRCTYANYNGQWSNYVCSNSEAFVCKTKKKYYY